MSQRMFPSRSVKRIRDEGAGRTEVGGGQWAVVSAEVFGGSTL